MKQARSLLAIFAVFALAAVSVGDVTFKVGNSTGTILEADDVFGAVNVVPLGPLDDGSEVVLELDKLWLLPSDLMDPVFTSLSNSTLPSPMGVPAGPTRLTLVSLPSAAEAGQEYFDIVIGDEKISNQTCVIWTDFHIEIGIFSGASTGSEVEVTGLPLLPPDARLPIVQLVEDGGVYKFDFYGGLWQNDGVFATLFDNNLSDEKVTIRVKLGSDLTRISIKEWPTIPVPEPATMGLLALGTLGIAVLRRRRRK